MGKEKKNSKVPARPTANDDAVAKAGILSFCSQFNEYDAQQLLEIWSRGEDGYTLARALEQYGMQPTEETVLELGQLEAFIEDAVLEAEKAWVKDNKIRLRIQPGQQVTFSHRNGENAGVVSRADPDRAIYYVKRDGDSNPTRECVVPAESLRVSVSCAKESGDKVWPCPICSLGPCINKEGE